MIFVLKLRVRCERETGELNSPEHWTCKSELCILGIEKRLVYFQDAAGLTAVNKLSG